MAGKERVFQLRYDEEEQEMLKKVAASRGLTASSWLRMMIREEYDKLEKKRK